MAKVFLDQIFLEKELEHAKCELALKPDFTTIDAFRLFDIEQKGELNITDFVAAFSEIIRLPNTKGQTLDDCYLIFRRYDKDNDGKLNFSEFTDMFLPSSREHSQQLTTRAASYTTARHVTFNSQTHDQLVRTLKSHYNVEQAHEYLRLRLQKASTEFNVSDLYNVLDRDKKSYLTIYDFEQFLAECRSSSSQLELSTDAEFLMQKYDKNRDRRVHYTEFVDELTCKKLS